MVMEFVPVANMIDAEVLLEATNAPFTVTVSLASAALGVTVIEPVVAGTVAV